MQNKKKKRKTPVKIRKNDTTEQISSTPWLIKTFNFNNAKQEPIITAKLNQTFWMQKTLKNLTNKNSEAKKL